MNTAAIREKFVQLNAHIDHIEWMLSILDDVTCNDSGHASFQPTIASIHASLELLFDKVDDNFYSLHELLRKAGMTVFDEPLSDGEQCVYDLKCAVVAMRTVVANVDFDDFDSTHACMHACHSNLSVALGKFRKPIGLLSKASKYAATAMLASVPRATPQNSKARSRAAEAVAA